MVFLIQNIQNRYTRAMHLELDELIRAIRGVLLDVEERHERSLDACRRCYKSLASEAMSRRRARQCRFARA